MCRSGRLLRRALRGWWHKALACSRGTAGSCSWVKLPHVLVFLSRGIGSEELQPQVQEKLLLLLQVSPSLTDGLQPRSRGVSVTGQCPRSARWGRARILPQPCEPCTNVPSRIRACGEHGHSSPWVCALMCVGSFSLGHIRVCARSDPTDGPGAQGPPTRGGCPHTEPCARLGLRTPGPGSWRCRDESRARRGSRDSVLDSCRSPSPGRSGHRGHVEPSGAAAGPGRDRGCRGWGGVPVGLLGAVLGVRVPSLGSGDRRSPGKRCLGACRRRRMPRARGGTVHAPAPAPVGRGVPDRTRLPSVSGGSGCASPGQRCQAMPRPQARGAPLCVGSQGCSTCPGFAVDLGCGCSSTCPWRSATAGTELRSCSGCQPSAGQGSGVPQDHAGGTVDLGRGQVAAEGGDQWCHAMPSVLCQEPAVPCSASGVAPGVSGTVQCPGRCAGGATQCPRCGATARAASVSHSKVQQLPPPRSPFPGRARQIHFRNDWCSHPGSAELALTHSAHAACGLLSPRHRP